MYVTGVGVWTETDKKLRQQLEGPEGVKWELGFGQIFTGKVGFGSLGLGFGHWEWES